MMNQVRNKGGVIWRHYEYAAGRGYDKKRKSVCNRLNRGKPMNARNSITSEDEKLAYKQLKKQWNSIDWKEVEKLVNRLQVRMTCDKKLHQ